jgi:hypothetical protein
MHTESKIEEKLEKESTKMHPYPREGWREKRRKELMKKHRTS